MPATTHHRAADRRIADAPAPPRQGPAAVAVAPVQTVAGLLTGLSYTVGELPHLVLDLRLLVGELTRAAKPGGELSDLLRGAADLAAARAEVERRRR
ncbi:MAG TPA: hypothetical protein VD931_07415 [Baekduia sp.]|nr:hypothetical protein [Baekduia sp.]